MEQSDGTTARPLPGLAGFRVACAQMLGRDDASPIGAAAVYYPAVGFLLGGVMVGVDALASDWSTVAASGAVMAAETVLTRGSLWRGLAATSWRLLRPRSSPPRPATAALSVISLVVAIALLAGIEAGRAMILLFAPMLAGCAMVVLATGSREARRDGRQVKFSRDLTFREFGLASTLAFAIVFLTTNFLGLILVLLTGATTIGLRLLFHWRLGGVDRASLRASGALVQLVLFSFMTSLENRDPVIAILQRAEHDSRAEPTAAISSLI